MIEIHGPVGTSADRCYWALEEIGQPYTVAPFSFRTKDHRTPAFLALNPNGKVPVIRDGDLVLWESLAINRYLATQYAPHLLGEGVAARAHVDQWSIWSQVEYQRSLITLFIQKMFVPEDKRDAEKMAEAEGKIRPLNAVLDAHLEGRDFMVGDSFTLADLDVASVARINIPVGIDLADTPNLARWFVAITERPAYLRVRALDKKVARS